MHGSRPNGWPVSVAGPVKGKLQMTLEIYPLDVAGLPNDEEAQATFLADAIDSGDPEKIAYAEAMLGRPCWLYTQPVVPRP